ncbi:MAG: hypothetical protein Q8K63_07970 [Acidimicrobiales bacterium]|nr:hypothetical protein [Acidimicrobiales bacterium]
MDDVSAERTEEAADQPVDFAADLDQLAVVEAELAAAEAELEALDEREGADPASESAS